MARRSLGTLTIDLIARTSGFTQGMDRARRNTKSNADQIWKSIERVRLATITLGAAAATALGAWVNSMSKTMDSAVKMADQIGTTTEALTGLRYAAQQMSNVSDQTLDMSLRRMTRRIAEAAAGSGAAKNALEDLGLSAKELVSLSVDEQFLRISDAMSQASDQGSRLRNTMAIFDTEGVPLINTLAQGREEIQKYVAEAERFGIVISEDAARAASDFQSNLTRLNARISGLGITLGNQFMPVLNDFIEQAISAADEVDGLHTEVKDLSRNSEFKDWFDASLVGLARIADVAVFAAKSIGTIGLAFKAAAADIQAGLAFIARPNAADKLLMPAEEYERLTAEYEAAMNNQEAAVSRFNESLDDLLTYQGNRFEQAALRAINTIRVTSEAVKTVDLTLEDDTSDDPGKGKTSTSRQISEGERYIESLKRQMEQVQQLTELETLRARMAEGQLTFATKAQEDQALAYAQTIDFIREQEEAYKKLEESRREFLSGIEGVPAFSGIDALIGGAAGEIIKTGEAAEELQEWYEAQLEAQREFLEQGVINEQEYADRVYEITKTNAERMESIQRGMRTASISLFQDMTSQSLNALETLGQKGSGIYKALFLANKAAAIAQAIINTEEGATKALAVLGPAGPPVAFLIRAAGYTSVAAMAATTITGMAHDGIDSVPEDGTWLLQKGERVTTAETSAKLDATLERINNGMNGGSAPVVNIIENPDRGGEVESVTNDEGEQELNIFVADIRGGGRRAQALEMTYGLQRVGA